MLKTMHMKPNIPFGIVSIQQSWTESSQYQKTSFTLTVNKEPRMNAGYFWAQQFWFHRGDGGYIGLQSGGNINGKCQKIAIFSIWKSVSANKSVIDESTAEPFAHEGSGFSCKIPFNWEEETAYKIMLQKVGIKSAKNTWQGSVVNLLNGESSIIGNIDIPNEWGNLKPETNFFVEYFRPVESCESTPFQKSTFENSVIFKEVEVHPQKFNFNTYGECASIGTVNKNGEVFHIATGHI